MLRYHNPLRTPGANVNWQSGHCKDLNDLTSPRPSSRIFAIGGSLRSSLDVATRFAGPATPQEAQADDGHGDDESEKHEGIIRLQLRAVLVSGAGADERLREVRCDDLRHSQFHNSPYYTTLG
jgi:hypothetical protein